MTAHLDRLKAALSDRYAIEREIGSGGMATVYLAEDLKHHRKVAVKVLRPELSATLGPERFVREIEIAANLTHPHILPLHDSGEAGGFLYYVMPFIKGESLRERLEREGRLSVPETIRLTDQIASALSHAHDQGLVHRDIKPENILCTGDQAIVADFGIARAVEAAGGEKLTGTGIAVGTPAYMSPEQAVGDTSVDARSDVYALGCVVYEMVAGRAPFEGNTPQALLAKHAVGTTPSLRTSDPGIPLFLERAVERALAKQPADRFQSASAFAEALTSEMVVARVGKRRRPRRVMAAVGVAAAALVAAWGLFLRGGGPTYERLAVLPPTNLMNDPEQDYFVQGMHNALITELQKAGIAVIARTSVMQYEDTKKPIREIASDLGVDALVEASVLRTGDSVEIEVSLVDGTTQQYVANPIVRRSDLRDIERLYRGLTAAIATEIRAALTPQARTVLASARPVDPQAYDDYLRGQFHLHRWTAGDLDAALEYFQRALQRDSTYAPAWLGIFLVWGFRLQLSYSDPLDTLPALAQASVAEQKLLELGGNSAEAQYAIALSAAGGDWDWVGAERAFRRAIEINPNYAECLAFYGSFLSFLGRFREAHPLIERAIELDPLNPLYRTISGENLAAERRFADAEREFRRVLQTVPDHPMALQDIWAVLWHLGRYDEAVDMLLRLYAGYQDPQDTLTQGLAEGGHRVALRRLAMYLGPRQPSANTGWFQVAIFYALAGEKDSAIANLERAYESHDFNMPNLDRPDFDALRDNPRFRDLCRRMNLLRCAQGSATPRGAARPGA